MIYSSDLNRAVSTLENLLSRSKQSYEMSRVIMTPLLREVRFGVREALPSHLTVEEARKIYAKSKNIPIEDVVDTAESNEEVEERQIQFFREIREKLSASSIPSVTRRVLILSHGGFIRILLRRHCGLRSYLKIHNCAISIVNMYIDHSNDSYSLSINESHVNILPQSINLK